MKNQDLDYALFRSIESNNLADVIDLLSKGADPNANNAGNTPLSFSLFCGNSIEFAKVLIEAGADVNAPDQVGNSLLATEASDNNYEKVKLLLKHGADPNKYKGDFTPLGAGLRDVRIVKILLDAGAKVDGPHLFKTPIIYAASENLMESAKILLENGADGLAALKSLKEKNDTRGVDVLNKLGIKESDNDEEIEVSELKDWDVVYHEEALKHAVEKEICADYYDPNGIVEIQWHSMPRHIFIYITKACNKCNEKFEFEFEARTDGSTSNRAECPNCQDLSEYTSFGLYEGENYNDSRGTIIIGSPKIIEINKIISESITGGQDQDDLIKPKKSEEEASPKKVKEEPSERIDSPFVSSIKTVIGIIVIGLLIYSFFKIRAHVRGKKIEKIEMSIRDRSDSFTDSRDGRIYQTIEIGTQVWMAENLAFKADSGCWALDGDESNVEKFGYLYNWDVANIVCPDGWHLPSKAEWEILELYLATNGYNYDGTVYEEGDYDSPSSKIAKSLASKSGWEPTMWDLIEYIDRGDVGSNSCPTFSNKSGFSALRSSGVEYVSHPNQDCYWWSSTEEDEKDDKYDLAFAFSLKIEATYIYDQVYVSKSAFSIRCVKD